MTVAVVAALLGSPAATSAGGYATVLFGRGQIVQGDGACRALPNAVDLFTALDALRARGVTATAAVTVAGTHAASRRCAAA